MNSISIVNPINNKKWTDFIGFQNNATIFHHPQWLYILNSHYKYKVFAVCAIENNKIVAGIPFCEVKSIWNKKKWISLPFSDHCTPLFTEESQIENILNYLIKEKKKQNVSYIEIRYNLPGISNFYQKNDFFLHFTDISIDKDQLFNSFKETQVKQPIKKALREGLTAEIRKDINAIENFYKLHILTRKKLGVPIQPKNYFKKLVKLLEENLGFVVLIKKGDIVISAGIFLGFFKTITFKYGASHPKYLKLRPNNLMLWKAMLEGKAMGFELFDFGRTEISNTGLSKFKSGWGSKEEKLYYSNFPEIKEGRLFHIVNTKLVSPLIKNSPKFVCRIIGELFYKYSS